MFADTAIEAGVVVPDRDAESQLPPEIPTETGMGDVLVTFTVWLGGAVAPTV